MIKKIDVDDIPKGGPYSHAIVTEELIFVSGQTGQIAGKNTTFEQQFENAVKKIDKILKNAGSSLDNVVKVSVYISNPEDFFKMNELFEKYFGVGRPARTTLVTNFVMREILVEIDTIALLSKVK